MLGAKFSAFVKFVTNRPKNCTKRPHYTRKSHFLFYIYKFKTCTVDLKHCYKKYTLYNELANLQLQVRKNTRVGTLLDTIYIPLVFSARSSGLRLDLLSQVTFKGL